MLWTFNQHNFTGGRLDKELMGRQDLTQYFKGASELRNFTIRRQGNLAKRRGTNEIAKWSEIANAKYRIIPLVYSKEEGFYLLLTGGKAYLVFKDGFVDIASSSSIGIVPVGTLSSDCVSCSTWLSNSELEEIDYIQSGDVIFLVHHNHQPIKIEFNRTSITLTSTTIDFAGADRNFSGTASVSKGAGGYSPDGDGSLKTIKYCVTFVNDNGLESFPSESKSASYKLPWKSGGKFYLTYTATISESMSVAKVNFYKDEGSGFGLIKSVSDGTQGEGESFVISGSTVTVKAEDDYITPDLSLTPPDKTSRRKFNTAGDYPSVVSLYQQRMVLGSSDNDPFTFWMSCTGDLFDFSTHSSLREDDAITATLAATEQPEINHAILAKDLMLFANSGEWEVAPISGNALSYKTISTKMQSSIGAARWTKPIIIGDEILFLDNSGERLLATRYNYATDGYESQELTVLSQWLFRNNKVRRMAYRKSPDSTIHCVMDDGSIAMMVYMKEHEVCAWTRVDLGGGYKALDVACSKADSRGSTDIIYLVESPSGSLALWRERDDLPCRTDNSIEDYVCMDGIVESNGFTRTSGDARVAVLLKTGEIVDSTDKMCLVGHPFECKLETVYPDQKGEGESAQMEILNATEVKVRTIDSSSFKVGACASSQAREVAIAPSFTDGTASTNYIGKIELPDCDARVVLSGTNAKDGRIRITHDGVWPLNILSLSTTYQVEMANQNGGGND